jgi:hypothetical protein
MTKAAMPRLKGWFIDSKDLSCKRCWQRVQPILALPFKKKAPCGPILNQGEIWMKFKKHIIISGITMKRNKIFCRLWHMQYFL